MGASPTPRSAEPALRRVAVATSGGRDSTALLHCTLRQAQALGIQVIALHVHHGLLPQADAWLQQVRAQSRRWGAGFDARRLGGAPAPGQSVEAWARAGRYAALGEMALAAGCRLVLLAHHRRDQAETWLLQALRGAGSAGLSAMPAVTERGGLIWARPWLDQPPEAIQAYVNRHRIRHVEDPSNRDARYARSRLRQQVWPILSQAFPDAEQCLHAAAAHAQDDAQLRAEVAAMDLPALDDSAGLRVASWLLLPPARQALALRAWLRARLGAAGVPESLVRRLLLELPALRSGRWPAASGELRLHRGHLACHAHDATPPPATPGPLQLDLSQPGHHDVPGWPGRFEVCPASTGGVEPAQLRQVVVRARQGGERFSRAPGAASRSLKKQFQSLALPAWERSGPLVYGMDGHLLFVPGLGVDARYQARPGVPQLRLSWQPAVQTGGRQRGR